MSCCSPKKGSKKGFTLIEMLIVIIIIGVLASALIPRLGSARGKANDAARKADLQQIATALISYQLDANGFPTTGSTVDKIKAELIKGGLSSLPKDTSNNNLYSGVVISVGTGTPGYYNYTPIKKNGITNGGFVLMAQSETEGGSNFIHCPNDSEIGVSTDYDSINLCTQVTKQLGSCSASACTYSGTDQLRYLYKY